MLFYIEKIILIMVLVFSNSGRKQMAPGTYVPLNAGCSKINRSANWQHFALAAQLRASLRCYRYPHQRRHAPAAKQLPG